MNWEYIAGFFDGEGSLSTMSSTYRPTMTIACLTQSGKEGFVILSAIRDFLWALGIKGYICSANRRGNYRQIHNLRMSSRIGVTLFLEAMLPRVSVKRVIVQDTLRYFKMYPSTNTLATIERNKARGKYGSAGLDPEQLRRDLIELGTRKAVAAKYGVNPYTITKYLDPDYRKKYDAYRRQWRAKKIAEMQATRESAVG
mgnify:CR=1 FL=1